MLPHREWNRIPIVTTLRQSDDNNDGHVDDWTIDHLEFNDGHAGKVGIFTPQTDVYQEWHTIFRPESPDFALLTSMNQVVDYGFWYTLSLLSNEAGGITAFRLYGHILYEPVDPNFWDFDLVNGKFYDGVNEWGDYPPGEGYNYFDVPLINIGSLPYSSAEWCISHDGHNPYSNKFQESFFRNCVRINIGGWVDGSSPPFPVGESCTMWTGIQKIRVNYLNAVVNNLSTNSMLPAGGMPLVLTGLGFDQDDAELGDPARNSLNAPTQNWFSVVDFIDFIGQQGQDPVTLYKGHPDYDFTVDSDTQITIPVMPALALGTYYIQLRKEGVGIPAPASVHSYVGDWTCNESGLCTAGVRTSFFVSEMGDRSPREGNPIVLTNWQLKKKLDLSFEDRSYSPKDVCCTAKFYDGRLKEISGLQRAVNDKTGLFISSDMTAKLVNVDKAFSKLLAEYYFKNEPIEMYLAFKDYPESWKTQFFRGFVEDHSLKGGEFDVSIRDLTTVFFQRKVPFYRITREEYPDAHESAIGRPMQEAIGQLSYIATEASGAMEAFLVKETVSVHRYLAARGSLKEITHVYKDGAIVTGGYAIVYADGGRTYIDFTASQGEAKITYNCKGYMFAAWNSEDGYIQHPVYVFLFYLTLIVGVPVNYIDFDSFEAVKDILDDLDPLIATSGYLGLMEEQDAMGVNQELCQTIGGAFFPDHFGRLKLAMKDISNITTSKFIFAGIDTMDHPQQDWNLKEASNRVKVNWNYIPAATRFLQSKEDEREDAIEALSGNRQEDVQPLDMKWTTNETLADKQMFNILSKRGEGYKRIKFKLPLTFVEYLDIYDSFRLQDPYGVSLDGSGDYGRFLYVEKIGYDWIGSSMDIDALDLTYILRRYLVLGDEDSLPGNWDITTEESKAFAYVCEESTGLFADGDDGKILVDENKIAM